MATVDCLRSLKRTYEDFRDCILSIPEELYLSPIHRWSPRDTVAHLVGWNRNMIEACNAILRGEAPSYYVDAPNDYRNINAAFVARYSSQNKAALLDELASSIEELQQYVSGLDRTELDADHGVVHHRGGPATVTRTVESLTGDYRYHWQKVLDWLRTKGVLQAQ
ncbi:MAG: ClbS/DfsB family four-helix bundle protein [Armatimonadota bacterium]